MEKWGRGKGRHTYWCDMGRNVQVDAPGHSNCDSDCAQEEDPVYAVFLTFMKLKRVDKEEGEDKDCGLITIF